MRLEPVLLFYGATVYFEKIYEYWDDKNNTQTKKLSN